MNKGLVWIITCWILLVAGFVAVQELNIATGTKVLLKTVPIDPRDFLRGDYVVLDYEVAHISRAEWLASNDDIYVTLKVDENNIASVEDVFSSAPKGKLYLKGKIKSKNFVDENLEYTVDYGISNYYVKEGKGLELERKLRNGGLVKVSVGRTGIAKVRSFENIDK